MNSTLQLNFLPPFSISNQKPPLLNHVRFQLNPQQSAPHLTQRWLILNLIMEFLIIHFVSFVRFFSHSRSLIILFAPFRPFKCSLIPLGMNKYHLYNLREMDDVSGCIKKRQKKTWHVFYLEPRKSYLKIEKKFQLRKHIENT